MIFYDFEITEYDHLAVFIDTDKHRVFPTINDDEAFKKFYEENARNIWVGFNNNHYDKYIYKAVLLGMDPKQVSDTIILDDKPGWSISREFNKIPMINYDVYNAKLPGLKALEGFMGNNIKESSVPFNIKRKLTEEEIQDMVQYCTWDVENTAEIFMETIDTFNAYIGLIEAFPEQLSLHNLSDTSAQLTANVLECDKHDWDDEFDFYFLPCLRLEKYKHVQEWFEGFIGKDFDSYYDKQSFYKSTSLTIDVAGVPHTFGFGGMHGAPEEPIHEEGCLFHVDANNYYPSELLAYDLVTRSARNNNFKIIYDTRKELKYKQTHASSKEEAKHYKKAQIPYKLILNALSGAMKDKNNKAYDPRNNNIMCINGQLMMLDLIEHLEVVPGFKLIQSNTDGIIIKIDDTDEAFDMMDDICFEWEQRCSTDKCSIGLETDQIAEIYQKDVNNYLWIDLDGNVERIGAYVKELSRIDYDLPIINKALVEYMVNKIPVEDTINNCDELMEFQKIVKLSNKFRNVEHNGVVYQNKCYRVFASRDESDGKILKRKWSDDSLIKFGLTSDHSFIYNDDVHGVRTPSKLNKQWYIDLAKKRLADFGL